MRLGTVRDLKQRGYRTGAATHHQVSSNGTARDRIARPARLPTYIALIEAEVMGRYGVPFQGSSRA